MKKKSRAENNMRRAKNCLITTLEGDNRIRMRQYIMT